MASSKSYLAFILEQLSPLSGITYRAMMGEYILYYHGKIVGGIYDDRLLVKSIAASNALIPNPILELPYKGGKKMILVKDVDSRALLAQLFEAMYDELPSPKPKKTKI
ncbi:MAG: TfoX/Sxy family protein [Candidatus Fimivivens sp.]